MILRPPVEPTSVVPSIALDRELYAFDNSRVNMNYRSFSVRHFHVADRFVKQ